WSLRHRWSVVVITLVVLLSTPGLSVLAGADFVPKDDRGECGGAITLPEGYSRGRADEGGSEVGGRLRALGGVVTTNLIIGDTTGRAARGQGDVTQATIYCRLIDLTERDYKQKAVMEEARQILKDYPDLRTAVQDVAVIQAAGIKQAEIILN